MADIAFGVVGGIIGSFFGNWQLGFSLGTALGGLLFPPSAGEVEVGKSDVRIQSSSYGTPIALVYGTDRTTGTIVWGTDPREVVSTSGGGKGKPKIRNYKYFVTFAVQVCEGPIQKINRIWANSKVIYESPNETGYVRANPVENHGDDAKWAKFLNIDDVRIYLGDDDQPIDPAIEAVMGTSNTPAYRNRVLVVFEDFPMTPFGNSLPNLEFEIQTEAGTSVISLRDMLDDIAERCKIPSTKRDFSALASIDVDGCTINSRTEAKNIFESAQKAYFFDLVEYDSKLRALLCSAQSEQSFDEAILGADVDVARGQQFELTRIQEVDIPKQVNVTYKTAALDFQFFAQNAIRVDGSLDEPETLQLPFVLGEVAAKKIAIVSLHLKDIRRTAYVLYYPLCGLKYSPGDVITPTLEGIGPTRLKIMENYLDFFGTIQSLAVEEDLRIYTQAADPTTVDYPNQGVDGTGDAYFRIGDTGPVLDEYSDYPTLLYAGAGDGTPWPGADVKVTGKIRSSAGNWVTTTAELAVKAVIGTVVAPLPDIPEEDTTDYYNLIQSVDIYVDLITGTSLSSATYSELMQGANLALWGKELIQFMTATSLGGPSWKLSGILRARRSTQWALDHVVDEQFVLIDEDSIRAFKAYKNEWNIEREHVMYEENANYTIEIPESINHTMEANSAKALPPVHIEVSRDGSNNATIDWVRQDRHGFDWLDGEDAPMSESELGFEVEIWDSGYATLKRTIAVSTETASYSAAEQTTDFGSAQSTIYTRIYQIQPNKPWARGHAAQAQG